MKVSVNVMVFNVTTAEDAGAVMEPLTTVEFCNVSVELAVIAIVAESGLTREITTELAPT